jgi:hypothetical protein
MQLVLRGQASADHPESNAILAAHNAIVALQWKAAHANDTGASDFDRPAQKLQREEGIRKYFLMPSSRVFNTCRAISANRHGKSAIRRDKSALQHTKLGGDDGIRTRDLDLDRVAS